MSADEVMRTVLKLSESIGPRPPGSPAEREAARYIEGVFRDMGLDTSMEPFESPSHLAVSSEIRVAGEDAPFASFPAQFTAGGDARGELVYLGMMGKSGREPDGLAGKIGLLMPAGGHQAKIDCLARLEERRLEGLIVVSPYLDNTQTKIVRYPEIARLPIAVVSVRTASRLARHVGTQAELRVTRADAVCSGSQNVVGTVAGRSDRWLAISAHHDTAPFAPGALDNASGVAVVIEAARRFAKSTPPATLCFVSTGSEEYGRLDGVGAGAQAFYDRRAGGLETCLGHVEIDDVGNVLGTDEVFIWGSDTFRDRVLEAVGPAVHYGGTGSIGCDHGAAQQRGVPWLWFTDANMPRPYYHSPEDTIEFFDATRAAACVDFAERAIAALAAGLPSEHAPT